MLGAGKVTTRAMRKKKAGGKRSKTKRSPRRTKSSPKSKRRTKSAPKSKFSQARTRSGQLRAIASGKHIPSKHRVTTLKASELTTNKNGKVVSRAKSQSAKRRANNRQSYFYIKNQAYKMGKREFTYNGNVYRQSPNNPIIYKRV